MVFNRIVFFNNQFVAVSSGGMVFSSDDGRSWVQQSELPFHVMRLQELVPFEGYLYIRNDASDGSINRTADLVTWEVSFDGARVSGLAADATHLWATVVERLPTSTRVYRSGDGENWDRLQEVSGHQLIGAAEGRIFTSTSAGYQYSDDVGSTWQLLDFHGLGFFHARTADWFVAMSWRGLTVWENGQRKDIQHGSLYATGLTGELRGFGDSGDLLMLVGRGGRIGRLDSSLNYKWLNFADIGLGSELVRVGQNWMVFSPSNLDFALLSTDLKEWIPVELPPFSSGQARLIGFDSYALMFYRPSGLGSNVGVYYTDNGLDWVFVREFEGPVASHGYFIGESEMVFRDGLLGQHYTEDGLNWQPLEFPEIMDHPNRVTLGPDGYYIWALDEGVWFSPSLTDWSALRRYTWSNTNEVIPGQDRTLLRLASDWYVLFPDGDTELVETMPPGSMGTPVWANGYFWLRRFGGSVWRSADGFEWQALELSGIGQLNPTGGLMALLNVSEPSGLNEYLLPIALAEDGFSLGWEAPFYAAAFAGNGVVDLTVTTDLAVEDIDRVEIWVNGIRSRSLTDGQLSVEMEFDGVGVYEIQARLYDFFGRVAVTDSQSVQILFPESDPVLFSEVPDEYLDMAVFKGLLYSAQGSTDSGGLIWASADGVHWQERIIEGIESVQDLMVTDSYIIARSWAGAYAVSPNGAFWRPVRSEFDPVLSDGRVFWAEPNAWSEDGIRWNRLALESSMVSAHYYEGTHYLNLSNGSVWASEDLRDWRQVDEAVRYSVMNNKLYRFSGDFQLEVRNPDESWKRIGQDNRYRSEMFAIGDVFVSESFRQFYASTGLRGWLRLSTATGQSGVASSPSGLHHNGVYWLRGQTNETLVFGNPLITAELPTVEAPGLTTWTYGEVDGIEVAYMGQEETAIQWFLNGEAFGSPVDGQSNFLYSPDRWGTYVVHAESYGDDGLVHASNPVYFHIKKPMEVTPLATDLGGMEWFFPQKDRLIGFTRNEVFTSFDGYTFYAFDGLNQLESLSLNKVAANEYGAFVRTDGADYLFTADYMSWVLLTDEPEHEIDLLQTYGPAFVLRNYEGADYGYLEVFGEIGSFDSPLGYTALSSAVYLGNDDWVVASDRAIRQGGPSSGWESPLSGAVSQLRLREDQAWAWSGDRIHMTENYRDWSTLVAVPNGHRMFDYLFSDGEHYLLMRRHPTEPISLFHSVDGLYWQRLLHFAWVNPVLFEFRDQVMVWDDGVYSLTGDPGAFSDARNERRFRLYNYREIRDGILFDPYANEYLHTAGDGWIWSRRLGWVYPATFGYPNYLFWSETFAGWFYGEVWNPNYWYSYERNQWGYIPPGDTFYGWIPVPIRQ